MIQFGRIALILIIVLLSFNLASATFNQNSRMGSSLPGQWESSMGFINSNTAENSVIAHWWDYGYWTQAVGEGAEVNVAGATTPIFLSEEEKKRSITVVAQRVNITSRSLTSVIKTQLTVIGNKTGATFTVPLTDRKSVV